IGIPAFADQNGAMMEADAGTALSNVRIRDGKVEHVRAGSEVVLSLGAIQTPKILMQSGIGDTEQLRSFGIGVVQHLPGVGANVQEHVLLGGCVWEYARPDQLRGSSGEATFFAKSDPALATPDLQA